MTKPDPTEIVHTRRGSAAQPLEGKMQNQRKHCETFGVWGLNAALYRPGERAEAFPGGPVLRDWWTVVYWWPGRDERISIHETRERALRCIESVFTDHRNGHKWTIPA